MSYSYTCTVRIFDTERQIIPSVRCCRCRVCAFDSGCCAIHRQIEREVEKKEDCAKEPLITLVQSTIKRLIRGHNALLKIISSDSLVSMTVKWLTNGYQSNVAGSRSSLEISAKRQSEML